MHHLRPHNYVEVVYHQLTSQGSGNSRAIPVAFGTLSARMVLHGEWEEGVDLLW